MWRCFSNTVVFFYLLDEQTSYLILVPAGLGVLIEIWKLQRALKVCSLMSMMVKAASR